LFLALLFIRSVSVDTKKADRLRKICENINKSYNGGKDGNKIVTYIGDNEREPLKRISSGCPQLDEALGGGWPVGRIVEIYGSEGAGKTTLCYHAIESFQRENAEGEVAWIDSEFSFDPDYAEQIGVDVDSILFHQPENGEQALEVVARLMSQSVKLIIVDSVAALTPRAEIEGEMGAYHVGTQARLMSQAMRKLTGETSRNNVILMFTNQERDKIGVMYGSKHTTPGGRALRFYASIRLELRTMGQEKDGDRPVAVRVKAIAKKNKTAPPLRAANFVVTFGRGIDGIAGLLDVAVEKNVVEKAGAWYNFGELRLGQGKQNSLEFLRNSPETVEEIKQMVSQTDEGENSEETETEEEVSPKQPKRKRGRPPKNKKADENTDDSGSVSVEDV
jgi:recombination protein RecA